MLTPQQLAESMMSIVANSTNAPSDTRTVTARAISLLSEAITVLVAAPPEPMIEHANEGCPIPGCRYRSQTHIAKDES